MTNATGLFKQVRYKAETTFGTIAAASGAQLLRRVSSNLSLKKQTYRSNEIQPDRQVRDFRHGVRSVGGSINGELSPATYKDFFAALLAATSFTAGVTTGALTTVAAASGTPGTMTRSAGSWITDGFKVGDVVQQTGWTTTGTNNNSRYWRVVALTATVMSLEDLSATTSTVATKVAGDSVTTTVVGKKCLTPLAGSLADTSFSIEHYFSDTAHTEVFTGCKISQAAISLPATGISTCNFSVMGQNIQTDTQSVSPLSAPYFTSPTAVTTNGVLAAVNGLLRVAGTDVAYITGATININGNYSSDPVVGSNAIAGVFPGILDVNGSLTALFPDTSLRDLFLNETTGAIDLYLTTNNNINADFVHFSMPLVKLSTADKDDTAGSIKQTLNFQALNNTTGGTGTTTDSATLIIQDSLA